MAYSKKWYEENKDGILKTRRSRYNTDPEYREKVKAKARERSRLKQAERKSRPKTVTLNGKPVPVTSIDKAASAMGIPSKRIAYFQKQGYIPPALVTRPARAYTKNQIGLIKTLETFLSDHSTDLRRPEAPEGKTAHRLLKAYIQTIHENWEN